jgi:hypothetical protein
MARRVAMPKRKDRKVFSPPAVIGKKINLTHSTPRGGKRM